MKPVLAARKSDERVIIILTFTSDGRALVTAGEDGSLWWEKIENLVIRPNTDFPMGYLHWAGKPKSLWE